MGHLLVASSIVAFFPTSDGFASFRALDERAVVADELTTFSPSKFNESIDGFDNMWFWQAKDVIMPFENSNTDSNPEANVVHVACRDGKQVTVPRSTILLENDGKKALWCPNAKVGTSTVFSLIAELLGGGFVSNGDARGAGQQTTTQNLFDSGREQALCDVDFSFTFLRNPWDRVRSAYLDKVNRVVFVPNKEHATFGDFLHAIDGSVPTAMNAHWMPISTRCATAGPNQFTYSKLYKLEDHFEASIVEAFTYIGIPAERSYEALDKVGRQNPGDSDHSLAARLDAYKSEDLRRIVFETYRDDIEVGKYRFDS
eukprot:TRINITY_DN575_c0_g1_i4.p1 TRINITY_DN575_c0_g1~~TRINITY_DN575_c0_g1_i4.p1  ORF type:complete len:314 (+),score=49.43 TRINITY_DN575_c0_g1_i4:55-996(+)